MNGGVFIRGYSWGMPMLEGMSALAAKADEGRYVDIFKRICKESSAGFLHSAAKDIGLHEVITYTIRKERGHAMRDARAKGLGPDPSLTREANEVPQDQSLPAQGAQTALYAVLKGLDESMRKALLMYLLRQAELLGSPDVRAALGGAVQRVLGGGPNMGEPS